MCTIVAGINAWFLACPGEPRKAGFGDASKVGVRKFEEKSAGAESAHAPAEVPTAWGGVVGRSAVGKESAAASGFGGEIRCDGLSVGVGDRADSRFDMPQLRAIMRMRPLDIAP